MKAIHNIIKRASVFLSGTTLDALRIIKSPRQSLRQIHGVSFFRNAVYLMANSGISLVLGFVFWVVVARLYTVSDVGYGSALLAANAFLSFIGTLGLGLGIIRFLPGSGNKAKLLNSSFSLGSLVSIVVSLIFLSGLSLWSPELIFVRENWIFFIAFVIGSIVATLNIVASQSFVAFRRSNFALFQGIITGILRLVLAIVLAFLFPAFGIFFSHGIALAIALGICLLVFLPRMLPLYRPNLSFHKQTSKKLAGFSFANYISEGLWSLPTWILPLIILNTQGAEANAYFYMAWSMANLLLAISMGISFSLFAEGSYETKNVSRNLMSSLKLIVLLLIPAATLLALLGDKLLLAFGSEYSKEGTRLLQILAVASLPASINFLYLGLARIEEKLKSLVLITGIIAGVTLVLSYVLLPHLGILGVGVGWLATQTVLVFFTAPRLVRKIKHPGSSPDIPVNSVEG